MAPSNIKDNSLSSVNAKPSNYPIRALVVLTAAVLLIQYVETMVLPGIPTIEKDLSTTITLGSWITSIVLLIGAAVSPIFGKLGDLYGKKKLIIVTLVFYTVGVSIAGFSTNIYFLIFARAIQGVGLAMLPLSLALLTDIFPKEKLATAQGAIAGASAISLALGLVLGAYVIQNLGWQFSFHTAAILSVVVFIAVIAVLKPDVPYIKCKIDYIGAFLLSVGIALILLYTTEGSALGWFSLEELVLLISGLALTISFFYFESKTAQPLISLNLLKIRNVLIANIVTIIAGLINFLLFFSVIEYLELSTPYGLGLDIIATGLVLVPGTIAMFILGPLIGRTLTKTGPKPILALGATLAIIGFLLLIANRGTRTDVTLGVIFGFAALVTLSVPLINMISVSLPRESVSVGQGFNLTLKQIGSAVGPVLTTTILATYTDSITRSVGGKPAVVASVPSATAFNVVFAVGIALSVIVIALSLAIKNGAFKKPTQVANSEKKNIS
jgi:MFS family permease